MIYWLRRGGFRWYLAMWGSRFSGIVFKQTGKSTVWSTTHENLSCTSWKITFFKEPIKHIPAEYSPAAIFVDCKPGILSLKKLFDSSGLAVSRRLFWPVSFSHCCWMAHSICKYFRIVRPPTTPLGFPKTNIVMPWQCDPDANFYQTMTTRKQWQLPLKGMFDSIKTLIPWGVTPLTEKYSWHMVHPGIRLEISWQGKRKWPMIYHDLPLKTWCNGGCSMIFPWLAMICLAWLKL